MANIQEKLQKSKKSPKNKYQFPMTASQEIGWDMDHLFEAHKPKFSFSPVKCPIPVPYSMNFPKEIGENTQIWQDLTKRTKILYPKELAKNFAKSPGVLEEMDLEEK